MAKTTFLDIPAGFDFAYNKALTTNDRFQFPSVRLKKVFFSRRRLKGLSQKSLLPQCSAIWKTLDTSTQNAWNYSGEIINITGFKLFVADYVLRLQNGMTGVSTPSLLYQTKVGKLQVSEPATSMLLTQLHPLTYWVSNPVRGKKGMREPVLVIENFYLPLVLTISYKTNLTSLGADSRARFYAVVYSNYQGRTIETVCEVPFDFVTDWKSGTSTISNVKGLIKSYALFLELNNVSGTLYVDNISAFHSGFNWARDSECRDLDQSFTKAFFQVPKNWVAVDISDGCFFGSVYYNAE